MLPGAGEFEREGSGSIAKKCGRLVRSVIEVLICFNVFASRGVLKKKRRVRNRKLECFKSLLAWILLFSLLYILLVAEPPDSSVEKKVMKKKLDVKRVKSPLSDIKMPKYQHNSYVNNDYLHDLSSREENDEREVKDPKERPNKPPRKSVDLSVDEDDEKPVEFRKSRRPRSVESNTPSLKIPKESDHEDSLEATIRTLQQKYDEVKKELDRYTNMKTGFDRANSVRNGFKHAFDGYSQHAWGHDEIRPETNDTNDSWGGFGVTLIDSLGTMCLLGFDDYLNRAEEHIRHLNFEKDVVVSFFETTIRHLGGLISGYECSKRKVFLDKAVELANAMMPAFDSPSGYPYHQINLKTGERKNAAWVTEKSILSEVASIQLEWYALSLYSKDPKFHQIAKKALDRVLQNKIENYPGLFYNFLDIKTGEYSVGRNVISIGGAGDSFYEYLLKISLMLPNTNSEEKESLLKYYEESIIGIRKFLVKEWGESENGQKRSYVGTIGDGEDEMEHLLCFFPGLLTLGYLEFPSQKESDLELGKEILETCIHLYESTKTGLSADRMLFERTETYTYRIQNPKFILRPETVESLFYMYRATGDRRFQDIGWKIWQSIETHCKTKSSYTGLENVRDGRTNNSMQSFYLSEVLKYLYLLFHPESESIVDLSKHVFSTEGQIFRRF